MRLVIANPNQSRLQQKLEEQIRRRPQLLATAEAELRFLKVMRKIDNDLVASLDRVLHDPRGPAKNNVQNILDLICEEMEKRRERKRKHVNPHD